MTGLPFITTAFADGGASPSGIEVGNPTPTYLFLLAALLLIILGAGLLKREVSSSFPTPR